MRFLLTAFEPFDKDPVNVSQEVLEALPDSLGPHPIEKLLLPCSFRKAFPKLEALLKKRAYDVVLCLGQAGNRQALCPERLAINLIDARIPDNDGLQPLDAPVREGGPAAYFSPLPVKAMVAAFRQAGLAARLSYSAGTYVCNQLMYRLLDHIACEQLPIKGGFLHLPRLDTLPVPGDVNALPASLDAQVKGLFLALQAILAYKEDLAQSMGTLD